MCILRGQGQRALHVVGLLQQQHEEEECQVSEYHPQWCVQAMAHALTPQCCLLHLCVCAFVRRTPFHTWLCWRLCWRVLCLRERVSAHCTVLG